MKVNEIIRARRKELGLTLKQVADKLGVSESLISRYESNDVKNMGIDKLIPLAKILKTTPAYLMGWEDEKNHSEKTSYNEVSVVEPQEQYNISREISSHLERKNKIEEIYDLVCENIDLGDRLSQPYIVIWDEIEKLIQENELLSEKILYILGNGPKIGLYSFITTVPSLSNSLNVVSKFIKQLKYAIVELRLNDQKIINVPNVKYSEAHLENSIAYMVDDKYYQKMKIMKGVDYE